MQASPPPTTELLHQGEIRWSPTSCPACHHPLHYSPGVLYQAQLSWIYCQGFRTWYHGPEYSEGKSWCLGRNLHDCPVHSRGQRIMMVTKHMQCPPTCWFMLPLDDSPSLVDSSYKGQGNEKSFYIIFITEGNCFYNIPKDRTLSHR